MTKTTLPIKPLYYAQNRHGSHRVLLNGAKTTVGIYHKRQTRKRKKQLRRQSDIDIAASLWHELSTAQKTVYKNAAAGSGLNGYQYFVKFAVQLSQVPNTKYGDMEYGAGFYGDIAANLPLDYTTYAYDNVGCLENTDRTQTVAIEQNHNEQYKIWRPILTSKRVFDYVDIAESYVGNVRARLQINAQPIAPSVNTAVTLKCEFFANADFTNPVYTQTATRTIWNAWGILGVGMAVMTGSSLSARLTLTATDFEGKIYLDNLEFGNASTQWAIDHDFDYFTQDIKRYNSAARRSWEVSRGAGVVKITTLKLTDINT